jgi:hypothetical protein
MQETFGVSDQTEVCASLVIDEKEEEKALGFDSIKPGDIVSVEYQRERGQSLALSIRRLVPSDSVPLTEAQNTTSEEEDFRPVPLSAAEEAFCTSMLEVAARMSRYLPRDTGN